MPYLSSYDHDVFVSYAHGPTLGKDSRGQARDPLSKWTQTLKENLKTHIAVYLRTKDPARQVNIWMDADLEGNKPLSQNLKTKIENSALLIVVMSDFYLGSTWCGEEVRWFADAVRNRGGDDDRVFVVRAYPTEESSWPDALKPGGNPLPGYFFHPPNEPGEPVAPFGWPSPTDGEDKEYWNEQSRLAKQITTQLQRLKWIETNRPPAGTELAAVPLSVGRSVFLGYMHDTLEEIRDELRHKLEDQGITVLPPQGEEDPVDESTLRKALSTYLGQSETMLLIANEYGGSWPVGQEGGHIGLQLQKAREQRVPCHLWLTETDRSKKKKNDWCLFIKKLKEMASQTHEQLDHKDLDAFFAYLQAKLDLSGKQRGVEQLAVVCMNEPQGEPYAKLRELIFKTLAESERLVVTPAHDAKDGQIKLKELESVINRADTILVVCYDQDWIWANNVIRELRQLNRTDSARRAQIFVVGPVNKQQGAFNVEAFKFRTVDALSRDEDVVRDQLRQVINGVGKPRN